MLIQEGCTYHGTYINGCTNCEAVAGKRDIMAETDPTRRYAAAMHAMQTGVSYKMQKDPSDTQPKHLRVGINAAMCNHTALVRMFIAKGLFTEEEYVEALADEMEQEKARYETIIREMYGSDNISLG